MFRWLFRLPRKTESLFALREAVDEYREMQHEKIERSHIAWQQL